MLQGQQSIANHMRRQKKMAPANTQQPKVKVHDSITLTPRRTKTSRQ